MAGRRTKLTRDLIKKICDLVSAGNYVRNALKMLGICEVTFYKWLEKGRNRKGTIYAELVEAVEKAKADAEALCVSAIMYAVAVDKDWRAAIAWLERCRPDRWYKPEPRSMSGDNEEVHIVVRMLRDEDVDRLSGGD